MKNNINIEELKRSMNLNKKKFIRNLHDIFFILNIQGNKDKYMEQYESMCDKMIELGIKRQRIDDLMEELNVEFDILKSGMIEREKVDLKSTLTNLGTRKDSVIEGLYRGGFIDSEVAEDLKGYFWDNRKRRSFSD